MEVSELMLEKLKGFEGLSLKACKAVKTEKYYTIGYGHYGADVKKGAVITEEQAEELLRKDLKKFETFVNGLGVCRKQCQFDALVDFAYNAGMEALRKSTLLKYIRAGKGEAAIRGEFAKWVYSGGKKLGGLVKRRAWEADRFFGKEA